MGWWLRRLRGRWRRLRTTFASTRAQCRLAELGICRARVKAKKLGGEERSPEQAGTTQEPELGRIESNTVLDLWLAVAAMGWSEIRETGGRHERGATSARRSELGPSPAVIGLGVRFLPFYRVKPTNFFELPILPHFLSLSLPFDWGTQRTHARTHARTHSRGLLLHGLLLPPQRLRVGGPHLLTVPPYFSQAPPALKRYHLPLLFPVSFAPASSSTPSSMSLPFLTSIIVSRDLPLISTLHQSSPLVAPSFSTLHSSIFNGTLQYLALRSVRPSRNAHPGGRKHFPASLADALRNRSEPL